jgi:hypothetical protein
MQTMRGKTQAPQAPTNYAPVRFSAPSIALPEIPGDAGKKPGVIDRIDRTVRTN